MLLTEVGDRMKKFRFIFVILFTLFIFNAKVQALTGTVNVNDALYLRESQSSSSNIITSFSNGTVLTILDTNGSSCSDGGKWYKVSYNSYTGYVCGAYVILNSSTSTTNNEDDSYDRNNYANAPSKDGTIMCYEDTGSLGIRSSVNGSRTGKVVDCGEEVDVLETVEQVTVSSSGSVCPFWYKIQRSSDTGYICGYYVNTTKLSTTAENYYKSNSNGDTKANYTAKLKEDGFPDSYINYLLELHARYPKWNFVAEKINLNFDDVVDGESVETRNVFDRRTPSSYDVGYLSTASFSYNILTNTFKAANISDVEHYNASREAIAYYLDPRNYLNEKYIFAFETLAYDSTQTSSVVSTLLSSQTFWPTIYSNYYNKKEAIQDSTGNVSDDVVKASQSIGISASHVAGRMKQELGNMSTSDARIGGNFTYGGTNYSGYYNFFNIKSSCSNCSSIYAGYAKEQGWNTPYKGIYGGAAFMYNGYISVNQDTLYYEKFDVSRSSGNYTHQYMQNLVAPVTEGGKKYDSYYNSSRSYLNGTITFVIPVYNNMPSYTVTAPKLGNPNNYLKDLKIDNNTVSQFNYETYNYNVYLSSNVSSVNVTASVIDSNAKVSGTGTIAISSNNQTNTITVTAQNGKKRNYTITFIRQSSNPTTVSDAMNHSGFKYNDNYLFGIEVGTNVSNFVGNVVSYNNTISVSIKSSSGVDKTKDSFRTGDKVTVTGSDGSKTYTAIIYGDVNGDGLIDKNDLLYVQSKAFGYTTLDTIKTVAADINKDGKVDKNDLLYVQSHVFGYSKISQG